MQRCIGERSRKPVPVPAPISTKVPRVSAPTAGGSVADGVRGVCGLNGSAAVATWRGGGEPAEGSIVSTITGEIGSVGWRVTGGAGGFVTTGGGDEGSAGGNGVAGGTATRGVRT